MNDKEKVVLLVVVNALCHMIEHADTGEAMDIHVAYALMSNNEHLKEWLAENKALLPLRRDGRTLLQRIEDYR